MLDIIEFDPPSVYLSDIDCSYVLLQYLYVKLNRELHTVTVCKGFCIVNILNLKVTSSFSELNLETISKYNNPYLEMIYKFSAKTFTGMK